MDRERPRPEGVGGIPRLTAQGDGRTPHWRRVALFVMLVGMLALPTMAVMFRLRSVVPPATRSPVAPLPVARTPPPPTRDERFDTLVGRARQAAQEGALPRAAVLLKKALELKPSDAEVWNSLGVILVQQGETVRGVDAFRQSLRFSPTHAEAHRNLAVVLDRQGRPGEAVAHYRAFLQLSPDTQPGRDDVRRRLAEVSGSRPEQ